MVIPRHIGPRLKRLATQFEVVAVMGPHGAGKRTLVRALFPQHRCLSLRDISVRLWATEDPRGFLGMAQHGMIIEDAHLVPDLFCYMQGIVDDEHRPGQFILTMPVDFIRYRKIRESLAGSIALVTLMPLSMSELRKAKLLPKDIDALLFKGFYPEVYTEAADVGQWCAEYISDYIKRYIHDVTPIDDELIFYQFLKACAKNTGSALNYADLARESNISPNTAKAWMQVLETNYIIRLVHPYYKSFDKRISKGSKLYFNDPSLVCWLLGIKSQSDLDMHPMKGAIMETFVMSEIFKYCYNFGEKTDIYFWGGVQGHEIDCLIEKSYNHVVPIEIKAGKTVMESFFKGLVDWQDISGQDTNEAYVVYGSDQNMKRKKGHVFAWNKVSNMMDEIYGR